MKIKDLDLVSDICSRLETIKVVQARMAKNSLETKGAVDPEIVVLVGIPHSLVGKESLLVTSGDLSDFLAAQEHKLKAELIKLGVEE